MNRRSYGQFCGLARALDIVGERWSLLIVRELLVGPARYGELRAALPGIATNLLADRLRVLEAGGVVERRLDADRNCLVYALTPRGAELREPIEALIRWSSPLMATGPGSDSFRGEWLVVALRALIGGRTSDTPVESSALQVSGTPIAIRLDERGPRVEIDGADRLETVLEAEPAVALGLASGALTVEQAIAAGSFRGNADDLAAAFGPAWP